MASGIFAILDDIGSLMDDVASASKAAIRKTTGVLGDDLAVNAEKATGFLASRELPVLWAITKGALLNKLIVVPAALLLSAFYPPAINVILVLGGFYLAYEGAEKVVEFLFHRHTLARSAHKTVHKENVQSEKAKIKAAVITDFMLSVEIVIIALGSVSGEPVITQIMSVSIVAVLATIGVYGIVALIVRMDDAGYRLISRYGNKGLPGATGRLLVRSLPIVIRLLGVAGTFALLLVAGGIFYHHIGFIYHFWPALPGVFVEFLSGLVAGLIVFALVGFGKKMFR